MAFMDWEDNDRYSFDDSERFEEESMCSWMSDTAESVCNNWRGWKKESRTTGATVNALVAGSSNSPGVIPSFLRLSSISSDSGGSSGQLLPLVDLAAKEVACNIPFEVVERHYPPVPEDLQLRIAFWSFPESEDDIRLYSCLANGSAEEFVAGEKLLKARAVKDLLQIGFHLSATVTPSSHANSDKVKGDSSPKATYNVAVTFDRRRIISCDCTCTSTSSWCSHVVAVCLFRIHQPTNVLLRAPVSESLGRLERDQLQKFAQYLIAELPQQILPTAQRLLDELLSSQQNTINMTAGAPDPTAGASVHQLTSWCLDESRLHENIRKILTKLCAPSPMVFADVNCLNSTYPPAAAEWQALLKPLNGRVPEGLWNLLFIVREMFRRGDGNSVQLLSILTKEVLTCDQISLWWFNTKVSMNGGGSHPTNSRGNGTSGVHSNTHTTQHACSSLADEIVILWRLAALNPRLTLADKETFLTQLKAWHVDTLEKVARLKASITTRGQGPNGQNGQGGPNGGHPANAFNGIRRTDFEAFSGFRPALEACLMTWDDYPIPGVTDRSFESRKWTLNGQQPSSSASTSTTDTHQGSASPPLRRGRPVDVGPQPSTCTVTTTTMNHQVLSVINPHQPSSPSNVQEASSSSSIEMTNRTIKEPEVDGAVAVGQPRMVSNRSSFSSASEGFCEETDSTAPIPALQVADEETRNSDLPEQPEESAKPPPPPPPPPQVKTRSHRDNHFDPFEVVVKKMEDPLEILFARAEALHAHGFNREASRLAVHLAEEMLVNPPNLLVDYPSGPIRGKKRRFNPANHTASLLASATLSKAAFLCAVLSETVDNHHLAFRIGLYGLEMSRAPASTKALEVKLANQETELANLLRKIPLTFSEMDILRSKATALKDGQLRSRGEALLPLILAQYVFDALVWSATTQSPSAKDDRNNVPRIVSVSGRLPSDELLGFEAAVAALGLKANISEAEHPLLCEGTRIQRRDLALMLLPHYKDDPDKLAKIMDKLLDKEIHQMYKNRPEVTSTVGEPATPPVTSSTPVTIGSDPPVEPSSPSAASTSSLKTVVEGVATTDPPPSGPITETLSSSNSDDSLESRDVGSVAATSSGLSCTYPRPEEGAVGGVAVPAAEAGTSREDAGSPNLWDDDYKRWEAKFRCTNLKSASKKHSVGMAAVDSSAPETTSSDNSPTIVRRTLWMRTGPPSDSGSSGESSDSNFGGSINGSEKNKKLSSGLPVPDPPQLPTVNAVAQKLSQVSVSGGIPPTQQQPVPSSPSRGTNGVGLLTPPTLQPLQVQQMMQPSQHHSMSQGQPSVAMMKGNSRFKGKRACPSIPNQPSEASSHAMFELAKQVLSKAGGSPSSGALFQHQQPGQHHRGPHRALHMCAFQIGVYALGLHNAVSPNWLSRTYSSQSKWVTDQAEAIGTNALQFLIETWEDHLTPKEVCYLADTASRNRDPAMVKTAARLALSALNHANVLDNAEIHRVLIQCQEQSNDLLESACLTVENAAKGGGIHPEMLFGVARKWYELYEEASRGQRMASVSNADRNHRASIGEFQVPPTNPPPPALQVPSLEHHQYQQPPSLMGPPPPLSMGPGLMATPPNPFMPPTSNPSYPYGFFPGLPPPLQVPHMSHPPIGPMTIHPAFLPQPSYPGSFYPPSVTATTTALVTAAASLGSGPAAAALRGMMGPQQPFLSNVVVTQAAAIAQAQTRFQMMPVHGHHHLSGMVPQLAPHQPQFQPNLFHPGHLHHHHHHGQHQHQPPAPQPLQQLNPRQLTTLLSAYRVGMLAMETLARRVHDDRPQAKYDRNPFYAEDVKWLLNVAKKLGNSYLHDFCICTVNSVASPFVLYDIVIEAAQYLGQTAGIQQPLRSHLLTPLIQKCQQMFIACAHFKIYHINPSQYEDFVSTIRSARLAFQLTPGGMAQFNELIQSLRRSKSFKKDLWQHLNSSLNSVSSPTQPGAPQVASTSSN